MVKLYNKFYDLDVVKRTKDLVDLSQETILDKFSIFYGNDISELDEGSVMMVTDLNLKTLGFFRKYKDENEFNIDCNAVFFDVTSHTGLDFDPDEYFKEDDEETKKPTSDKRLGFSGAIKRAQERNNAKKLRYKEDNKEQPKDLGDRMADAIKRDIESYDSSEDKFQGVIGDMVNQPSHYTFSDKFEIIDVVEEITKQYPPHLAFAIGNAIKYIARSQHKNGKQDISKSIWYLQRVLDKYDKE